ncbi:chaperonin-60kD, ch60 [Dorcoceras hygrometricum]|uniref:Chaperonin-60kD, ch60 n=1 Tax=Dorcoceras hygrometricum TaxID=472368 RepID=A0A2Z7BZG3_9LAMI|nr:chaperonin-60kD, ch60 [Dorcoceras hygrometricum]
MTTTRSEAKIDALERLVIASRENVNKMQEVMNAMKETLVTLNKSLRHLLELKSLVEIMIREKAYEKPETKDGYIPEGVDHSLGGPAKGDRGGDCEELRLALRRIEIPAVDGMDPVGKCRYTFGFPPSMKSVPLPAIFVDRVITCFLPAVLWFQWAKSRTPNWNWDRFAEELIHRYSGRKATNRFESLAFLVGLREEPRLLAMNLARSVEEELMWSPGRHTSKEGYNHHRWEGRQRSMDQLMGRGATVDKWKVGRAQLNERSGGRQDPTRQDGINNSTSSSTPRQATPSLAYGVNRGNDGRLNEVAGDGTKCATVLTQAIFAEGCKLVAAGMNAMDLRRGISMAVDAVVTNLKSSARMISTSEEIAQVGTISANGEREIGELIAKAMGKVGTDGVSTIQEGKTLFNELEVGEGMKLDRGYISPYFVTNQKNQKCEMDDALNLIHEKKISSLNGIVKVLALALERQRPLLIVAEDVESEALATLILNKISTGTKVCAIKAPGFGENKKSGLQDLAVPTAGQVLTEELVMYDATGVRLHAGRQAEVLNQIVCELPAEHPLAESRPLRELLGHTPSQVDRVVLEMRGVEDKGCLNNGLPTQEISGGSCIGFDFHKRNGVDRASHHHRTALGKPTPSKWDDAQKWLVNLSRGEKNQAKASPRNSNADDRRLIVPVPKKDYSSDEDGPDSVIRDQVETKTVDCDDQSVWRISKPVDSSKSVVRSVCVRDMGTEMTPIASQEPSRAGTPIRANTPAPRSPIASDPAAATSLRCQNGRVAIAPPEGEPKRANVSARKVDGEEQQPQPPQENNMSNSTHHSRNLNALEIRAMAWDEAERAKYMASIIFPLIIQDFKNFSFQSKAERMKTRALEKYTNKLAESRRMAEEQRANAESKLNEMAVKTSERADYIRRTGHLPSTFSFKLPSCCW